MAAKIVTYSFDDLTLKKMSKLSDWMRVPNKSNLLRILVDKEYSTRYAEKENDPEEAA